MNELPLVRDFGTLYIEYKCNRWHDVAHVCLKNKMRSILVTVTRDIDLNTQKWTRAALNWCGMGSQDRRMAQKMAKALTMAVLLAEAMDAGRVRAKFYEEPSSE